MRILHLSTFGEIGGAGRAAYRLHLGLRRAGLDSLMFVETKNGTDPSILAYARNKGLFARLKRRWRRARISRAFGPYTRNAPDAVSNFSSDETPYGADPWQQLPPADVIHLHWIAYFLDYTSFFASRPKGTRLVLTLHDMAPLAGGCHWTYGCERFTKECGACPQLGSKDESDVTRRIWLRKRLSMATLEPCQLHIVAPSHWLAGEAKRSALLSRFSCSVIPYGLDTDVFAPRDRSAARRGLGIPEDAKVILFAADGINVRRKGLHVLLEALRGSPLAGSVVLLSVGRGEAPSLGGIASRHLGPLDDDERLSFVYSAADIFVVPSEQDNLPNTILESLACGTPVVASGVGGIPDAVRPGLTGVLANPGDPASLRGAMVELLATDEKRAQMSSNCRKIALEEYSLPLQARRYMSVYQEVLGECGEIGGR